MSGWLGFLGLGGADLTRTQWQILEVLVSAEAQKVFGTSCATVDEMSLAARALRERFRSEDELKAHLRALAKSGRRMMRERDKEHREARRKRIAEKCVDCGRHPAPISFFAAAAHEAFVLCHACAMERHSLDKDHTARIELDVELFYRTREPPSTSGS